MIKALFKTIDKIFIKIESFLLILFFAIIFIAASTQIIFHILGSGVPWIETMLKYSVLWVGLIAANIATSEDKQIRIDFIGRFVKKRANKLLSFFAHSFAFLICGILFVYFVIYLVTIEYTSTAARPFLNIPRWVLLLIVPFSFFNMAIKYLIFTIRDLRNFILNKIDDNQDVIINNDIPTNDIDIDKAIDKSSNNKDTM